MPVPTHEKVQHDYRAMTVARVLAIANDAAAKQGVDLSQSLITITEESTPSENLWRVHFGPRDYKHRRGGDLIVLIDEKTGAVREMIRGQ